MSFLFVFLYDIAASGIGIISVVCVGMIFFKRMPVVRKGSGLRKLLLVVLCGTCMAALAALLYTTGLLRNGFAKALAPYITLAGEAVCISLIFEERLRACWGIVVFSGVVTDFAQAVSFVMSSRESFHMRIAEERIEYMARSMIAGPAVFILLLFILHKMEAGKAYSQWMEHEDTWKWGMICLSLYPVLTTGIAVWFMNNGMRSVGSLMLSFVILFGTLLIFNYAGHTEEQQKELAAQQLSLQQQNAYIETLEGMQEEMRRFRHDYKNMMSGMYLQAKKEDFTELSDFIQEMTDDFEDQIGSQIRKMSQLRNIYMSEVKGLLFTKFKEMKKEGISCELEVMYPFYGTALKATDLCRCLGILIDNAMDEVRGKEDAGIHIMISKQEGATTFRVKNTLYHSVDFHKIWQQGYSTRGAGRGIGLASYKRILGGYDNVFPVTAVQDGCFIQELKVKEKNTE